MLRKFKSFIRVRRKLDPAHLKRQAVMFLLMSTLILMPLWAINLHLSRKGFSPALPGFIVEAGQPVPGNGDFPTEEDDL